MDGVEKVEAELSGRVGEGLAEGHGVLAIAVSVVDLGLVLAENARLREQVTALQNRGRELIEENRALRREIESYYDEGPVSES